jgi:dolichyl-diphosphooligosaccharide--protein glycosyltransferase
MSQRRSLFPPTRVALRWGLIAVAAAIVLHLRLLPSALDGVPDAALLRYRGEDGREHVYLGDVDSYLWLRYARNDLRSGTTCDAVVGGECRDLHTNAPVGTRMRYARSLHVAAIVGLHRLIRTIQPEYPLPASAFWVPVFVGVLGTVPCFLLGERLAGLLGGFAAGLLVGTNPFFLQRTIGSDDDVWNVVLPLFVVASLAAATGTSRARRQAAYALAAVVFLALDAATWSGWVFTYVVTTLALVANVLTRFLRVAIRAWQRRPEKRAVDGLVPLAIFCPVGALFAALVGSPEGILATFHALASQLAAHGPMPPAGDVPAASWPDVLATVTELARPDLRIIAAMSGQPLYFFAGWLGLLLLWQPRTRWQARHLVAMVGGTLFYYYLLTGPQPRRSVLVALLSLPLAVGMILAATGQRRPARDAGAAFLLTAWFAGALYLSYGGARFVLLLVAPAAIACAVAIGRLHQWLARTAAELAGGRRAVWATVLFVLLAGTLVPPVQRGVAEALAYVPEMNDAWWDTLTHIRDAAPADAIVDTWWDYGHWTTYVAERRVSGDGTSLRTHVPYWLARAFMATSERETLGLLRMLNCGSDATPEPEGRLGAYGKLVARGLDDVTAHAVVVALASVDRPAARTLLAERGLAPVDVEDVLASTHCAPPPAYLVLSTKLLARTQAIRYLAGWDLDQSGIAAPSSGTPAAPGLDPTWRSCARRTGGADWECAPPEEAAGGRRGTFAYRPDAPERSRFLISDDAGAEREAIPAVIVLAEAAGLRELRPSTATDPELGVLVDVPERRALVGPPDLLRSTLVHLLYLDGRYARHLEKFDERGDNAGERVVTWRVHDTP